MSRTLEPHAAFEIEELIESYETRLLRMCFLYLHELSLAENAVQETFLKAYKTLATFRGESNVESWLTRIAINVCKDMRRGAWFRRIDRVVTPEMLPEPVYQQDRQDDSVILEVMCLPERLRTVVLLYYYQDMPVMEIGRILSVAASTVYHRLKVAQRRLKERLEGWYFDEG